MLKLANPDLFAQVWYREVSHGWVLHVLCIKWLHLRQHLEELGELVKVRWEKYYYKEIFDKKVRARASSRVTTLSLRVWHQSEHVLQIDLWRRQNLNNYTNRRAIAIFLTSLLHEIELVFLLNQNFLPGSERRTSCSSFPVLAQVTTTPRSDLGTESSPKTGFMKIFCKRKQVGNFFVKTTGILFI